MRMYSSFLARILVLVMMMSIVGNATVMAAPEALFAYTITDSGYSVGKAGAIKGERTALSAAAFTPDTDKITDLNGDPAFFNFYQGNESRLVLRQYTYSPTAKPNKIIDPFAASWVPSLVVPEPSWSNVANLHAVATKNQWMYATGYDLAKIAVINMNNNYAQTSVSYQFPTSWPAISLPSTAEGHGEGLVVDGNNLYALFSVNPNGGYGVYSDSIVIKFTINPLNGALTYVNHLFVGKNAFTLDIYDNKLYVCAVGGMQNPGFANPDTRLDIIDLATFTKTTVTKLSSMTGEFRDISIVDANHAYVFLGNYDASFANMVGGIYYTTVANLTSPSLWQQVTSVNSPGYLWGIYADANRLWFIKGTPVDIFSTLPTGSAVADKNFTAAQMGQAGGNLNSATIVAPDKTTGMALKSSVAKSFASHSVLAQQARKAAEKVNKGLKTVNGQKILSFN